MKQNNGPFYYLDDKTMEDLSLSEKDSESLGFINRKIASGENLKEIMDFLFEEIRPLIPCDRLSAAFLEDGDTLELYHVVADYDELHLGKGYSSGISKSSLKKIFESGKPRVVSDLQEYGTEHRQSESTTLLLKEGIRSSMTCPLMVDDRAVGVLFFSSREPGAYGDREIGIHLAIAERLSQAVEKAYRIEKLSEAINSYMEVLSFVTHELKSPIDSMITQLNTLEGGYFGPLEEKQKSRIASVRKKAEHLSRLVFNYLNLSRIEEGRIEAHRSDVSFNDDILQPALDIVEVQAEEKGMEIATDLDEKTRLNCDPELLKIVLINFLSNAVKYGNEGGKVKVTASLADDRLRFSVWNEGQGFSGEERALLFKKFSRLQSGDKAKKKGSGIGLYTSRKIVQLHGGKVGADSEEGKWAEFYFTLPVDET